MSITRTFTKSILMEKLDTEISQILSSKYMGMEYDFDTNIIKIMLSEEPTLQEDTDLTNVVNNHVPTQTLHITILKYLRGDVNGFISDLLDEEAATNMQLGITQLGKTSHVLGLMTKKYDIDSNGFPISLADTFKFKSLYETLKILQYIRNNPSEFNGLNPFVTDARLLAMKNKIEEFLGVPIST